MIFKSNKRKSTESLIYPCFSKNPRFAKKPRPTKKSTIPKSFPVKKNVNKTP